MVYVRTYIDEHDEHQTGIVGKYTVIPWILWVVWVVCFFVELLKSLTERSCL